MLRVLRGFNGEFAPVLRAPLFVFPWVGSRDCIPPTSKPPSFPDRLRMLVDPLKRSGCPSPMRPFLLLASTFLCLMAGRLCADPLDHWTLVQSFTNHVPGRLAFGNGRFVLSMFGVNEGRNGVWTSQNGKDWRLTFEDGVGSLLFANGLFVASASGGRVVTSEDGETWITKRLPASGGIDPIIAALGKFWIVAREADTWSMLSSADAREWATVYRGSFSDQLLFGDSETLVIQRSGSPHVQLVSTNGVDFSVLNSMPVFTSVAKQGATWVGVEATNPEKNISVSTNGTDWVSFRASPHLEGGPVSLIGGRFFLVNPTLPFFLESQDGMRWSYHEVGLRLQVRGVAFGNDAFLSLSLQRLDTPKPGVFTSVTRLHLSRPLTPTLPQPLQASLRPALVLRSGIVGAGYSIESATKPEGPWIHATTVFPTNFPFSVMVPDGHGERGFFRSVLRDR